MNETINQARPTVRVVGRNVMLLPEGTVEGASRLAGELRRKVLAAAAEDAKAQAQLLADALGVSLAHIVSAHEQIAVDRHVPGPFAFDLFQRGELGSLDGEGDYDGLALMAAVELVMAVKGVD